MMIDGTLDCVTGEYLGRAGPYPSLRALLAAGVEGGHAIVGKNPAGQVTLKARRTAGDIEIVR